MRYEIVPKKHGTKIKKTKYFNDDAKALIDAIK
jgi:hypothetical protein